MAKQAFADLVVPDDGTYHVYAMCFGTTPRRVHDNFIVRDMHDGPMPADYFLWIVRNKERTVLVDTGFSPRASAERNRPLYFDPMEGLARLGLDPAEIEDVVISHLHYDHAGNIDRFAKARFHIQDAEVAYATGRSMCDHFCRAPFDVEDVVALVRRTYADRVIFHQGDDQLFPGLTLHAFPGHSASVQALRVETPRGPVLLASDAVHYFANIISRKPFLISISVPDTLHSYQRMMEVSGGLHRLIPGHDPAVRKMYPSVKFDGIELLALHEEPAEFDFEELTRIAEG